MKIIRPDGSVIPSSSEGVARKVRESLSKKGLGKTAIGSLKPGYLRRFNQSKQISADEYIVEDLQVMLIGYAKGQKLTKEGVVALFGAISKHAADNQYYVGITCDPDRREDEHNADFLAVIGCPNKEKANELEKTLGGKGYDAGDAVGNAHKLETKNVYIYKKSKETIE